MNSPIVVVDELCARLGGRTVLDNVSMTMSQGTITGLIGPNGAGKTTLMRCISALYRPNSGSISIRGIDVTSGRARRLTALMPEQPDLHPGLSVAEHLDFLGRLYQGSSTRTFTRNAVERYELCPFLDRLPHELSQGTKRKVALVLAMLKGAEVLLFDEPFNGLDPRATADLRQDLLSLRDNGATVLLSMHGLGELERIADQCIMLMSGTVRWTGATHNGRDDLESVYLRLTEPHINPATDERP